MVMAVEIGPDGGVRVEVLAAMSIEQHGTPALTITTGSRLSQSASG